MGDVPEKIGRYEIRGILGQGAMGVVYRGWDTRLEVEVAIKVLVLGSDATCHADEVKRFLREVKITRTLKHSHIVSVYDVQDDAETGRTYIVMELVQGIPLSGLLKKRQLSFDQTVALISQVAEGLDYAAQAGVVHRDIKPANILVDPDTLAPKIVDFGVARLESPNSTQTQTVIGTPHYMSPEQWRGDPVDGRSDIFSLGAVLYELVTGGKAFPGDTMPAVMTAVLSPDTPVPPAQVRPGIVPQRLSDVIMKALAKTPKARFQRGRDLITALQTIHAGDAEPLTAQECVAIPGHLGPRSLIEPALKLVEHESPRPTTARSRAGVEEWVTEAEHPRGRPPLLTWLRTAALMILITTVVAAAGWLGWPAVKSLLASPVTLQVGILKQIDAATVILMADGDTVRPTDRLAIYLHAAAPTYVYVWRIGPMGRPRRIFPNPALTTRRNPILPGEGLWVPGSEQNRQWLPGGGRGGPVEVLVVATAEPLPRLKDRWSILRAGERPNTELDAEEQVVGDATWLRQTLGESHERGTFIPPPGSSQVPVRTIEGSSRGLVYQIRLNAM